MECLKVKEIGSFHIGGGNVSLSGLPIYHEPMVPGMPPRKVDPNGDFETGQMYVHYTLLAKPSAKYPLLFWDGGGALGVNWETKPDGAAGWEMLMMDNNSDKMAWVIQKWMKDEKMMK